MHRIYPPPLPLKLSHRYATEVDFQIYEMGPLDYYMAVDFFIPNPPLDGGGGLIVIVSIFLGVEIFFRTGLRNFLFFWGGGEKFLVGLRNFRVVEKFRGGGRDFFQKGLRFFGRGWEFIQRG